jgi:hypothetical protein
MSRYLVNFGDSWANVPGGPHINNPCYAAQLSRMTDRRFVDMSQPSTSVSHIVLQFRQFIQDLYQPDHDYLAVFFVTAKERQLAFDDNGCPRELHPNHPESRTYYQDIYTDQLGEFVTNTTILTLQSMAIHYNIDDRYLLGWQQVSLWPEVDQDRFYDQAQTTAMGLLGGDNITECAGNNNLNFIPGDGHPSILGHTQIAQALHQWIQRP